MPAVPGTLLAVGAVPLGEYVGEDGEYVGDEGE